MKRYDLIQSLDKVNDHINTYQNALLQKQPDFMLGSFWTYVDWKKRQDINERCLKFWKWKNNEILKQLKL